MKKITVLLLTMVLVLQSIIFEPAERAEAATTYITVEAYAKKVAKELGLKSISGSASSGYVNALIKEGIIKEGEFTSYTKNITRADALVIINRADDYLYGDKTDKDLVQTVIEKRISDISKIAKAKREDVAKAYIKGYMKGYSNGNYSSDREIRGTKKITKSGATTVISLLKNKKNRAKLSPDGQLLRTTNLPNNAYMYPYILASFPNRYYEGRLVFENITMKEGDKLVQLTSPDIYAYPCDVGESNFSGIGDMSEAINSCVDHWVKKAQTYMKLVLNFNYKQLPDDWKENVIATDTYNNTYMEDSVRNDLDKYINQAIANKSIIECDKVAIDQSSLYFFDGSYYLRCYVKYRIKSSEAKSDYSALEITKNHPYKALIYSRERNFTDLRGYKLNQWREEIYDIQINTLDTSADDYGFGVFAVSFIPNRSKVIERK